ncbi:MAG: Bcr/CflA family multidrug efflux MFS transporter [Endozoicomonas sp.]|uniref:Bcr/CflA family multidrug efflux MFS transporter n=1 Tax=Endozoicomonas sp. TaxID=1892382 RepID=UPI003D9ABC65
MTINIENRSDRLLFILTLGALTTLGPLAIDLYLPAIPAIAQAMGEPLSTIQYTLSAYTIGFALGQLLYGPLSDRFGRRKIMFPGLIAFLITNVLAALCETGLQLIIVRILQAMAGAAVMVTIPAMVRDLFPRQESAKVMSSILMVMTVAPLIAPLLGGQILKFLGWESLFIFLAILTALAMVLAVSKVPETLSDDRKLVIPASQLCLTYLSVLKNREAMGCILCHAFFFGGMFAFIAGSPYVYIDLYGVKPESYGLLFAVNIIAMMAMNMINIRLIGRLQLFSILKAGCTLAAISSVLLLVIAKFEIAGLAGLMIPIVIYISCIGLTGPNSNALALSHFPKSAGTANAMAGALRFTIGGVSSAVVGLLHNGTAVPMAAVMAICGLLSVASLLLVKNQGIPLDEQTPEGTPASEAKVSA